MDLEVKKKKERKRRIDAQDIDNIITTKQHVETPTAAALPVIAVKQVN